MKNTLLNLLVAITLFLSSSFSLTYAQCPTIVCPGSVSVDTDPGVCSAVVNFTAPEGIDLCTTLSQTFNFSGSVETWTVPERVTSITIESWGAQGANAAIGGTGGLGGYTTGTLAVTPGQVLYIYVGGQNGYNGGGIGGVNGCIVFSGPSIGNAGNGGGASDVRVGGTALTDRILVAGGGGGAGHNGVWSGCQLAGPAGNGGAGGGLTGDNGTFGIGVDACSCGDGSGAEGQGGTQIAGGLHGDYHGNTACLRSTWTAGNDGVLGDGGNGSVTYHEGTGGGGGGGGGYYGGGSGGNGSDTTPGGGGGGGSSYTGTLLTATSTTSGTRSGDGMVKLTFADTCTTTRVSGLSSGSTFPVGVTVQKYLVTNHLGDTSSCTFTVTVTDATNPTFTCPSNLTICTPTSQSPIAPSSISDNCSGTVTVTYILSGATIASGSNDASSEIFNKGITTVKYYFDDGNGNIDSCSFDIDYPDIDVSVTQNSVVLTANTAGATSYQWINCAGGAAIPGATLQSYTATSNGDYAVIIENFGCTDTSACVNVNTVGIADAQSPVTTVYPNPSTGMFTVELNESASIEIYSAQGSIVFSEKMERGKHSLSLDAAPGVYLLKASNDKGSRNIRIVINQ